MSITNPKGRSRRTSLMYPDDIWPNGVEVLITDGLFEIYPGEAIFNSTNGRVTSSGWSLVIAPLKRCHWFTIRSTRAEYTGLLDKEGNVIASTINETNGPSNIPANAYYVYKSCRNSTASNVLKGITFYYFPTHSDTIGDPCVAVVNQDNFPYAGGGANNYSNFIEVLDGTTKIKYGIGFRGCAHWYNENKRQLFARSYGDESGTYIVPQGAKYFKSQGYDGYVVDKSFVTRYWLSSE